MATKAARMGMLAGGLAVVGGGVVGLAFWQANNFDAVFADFAKSLPEEAARYGVEAYAEETGRDWTHREIAVVVKSGTLDFRWTGKARFGYGTTTRMRLDTSYGTAAKFPEMGIQNYKDEILVNVGITGRNFDYSWTAEPFRIVSGGSDVYDIGRIYLKGIGDLSLARLEWDGLSASNQSELLNIGAVAANYRADADDLRNASFDWSLAELNYRNMSEKIAVGESKLGMTTRVQPVKEGAPTLFDFSYEADIGPIDEGDERLFDSWKADMTVANVSEPLAERMLAGAAEENAMNLLMYLQYGFMEDGLTIRLDRNEVTLEGARVAMTGTVASAEKSLGEFTISMDPAFVAKKPELMSEADMWLKEGLLKEEDGIWVAHGTIDPDGNVYVNGKPL